jgi:hypothetical protein
MATIKLVSPDPAAAHWRAALRSVTGLPGESLSTEITLKVLTKNYYKMAVEELDSEGEVIRSFALEELLTVSGEYQINGQDGTFSQIS